MFAMCYNKGFHLTFDNDITLSTQIGPGNYCDNYDEPFGAEANNPNYNLPPSTTCELAIWDKDNVWITGKMQEELFGQRGADSVMGRVPMEDWLKILNWCVNYKK